MSAQRILKDVHRGWLIALVLWTLFIWGNSLVPGDASSAESGFILTLLRPLIQALGITDMEAAHSFIRKCGHFSEYLVLALLAVRAFGVHAVVALAIIGIVAPCIDETIQLFVPGRCGMVTDVLIDMVGFASGWVLCALAKRPGA